MKTQNSEFNMQNYKDQCKEKFDTAYKEVDKYVSKHPYRSLGIAAAVGLVLGALIKRD